MEDRAQRYVKSLDMTIQNNYHYLKETIGDFSETCKIVLRKESVPQQVIGKMQRTNKEIQTSSKKLRRCRLSFRRNTEGFIVQTLILTGSSMRLNLWQKLSTLNLNLSFNASREKTSRRNRPPQ